MISQKMRTTNRILVNGLDLHSVTDLHVRIKQGSVVFEVPLTVIDQNAALLMIDTDQACRLTASTIEMQLPWKDENGNPDHSPIKKFPVAEVIGGRYD